MTTLHSTPRDDGFYMPAEWAPQTQTWMIWPERPDNWRLGGKPAQAAHVAVAKAIARFEPVTVAVSAGQYENARARLDVPNIRVVEMSSDDAWVRDTGPTFVINNGGEVRGVNWDFNAWGGFDGGCTRRGIATPRSAAKSSRSSAASATAPRALCLKAVRSMSMAKAR